MNIVKPSHQILKKQSNPLLTIETAGRTCYKSEANITNESAVKFVKNLISRKHYAMLEHATVYLRMRHVMYESLLQALEPGDGKYLALSDTVINGEHICIASGNIRAWYELLLRKNYKDHTCWSALLNIQLVLQAYLPAVFEELPALDIPNNMMRHPDDNRLNDSLYAITEERLCELLTDMPEDLMKHRRISVKFVCDRGVTHEFVRHRDASFAQESTRYCCYAKEQFNNEITVIAPLFFEEGTSVYSRWQQSCQNAENAYFGLLESGATAQEARSVLPNSLKSEIIITATETEWQHICNLRAKGTTGAPHPQMKEVMYPCYTELMAYTDGRIS